MATVPQQQQQQQQQQQPQMNGADKEVSMLTNGVTADGDQQPQQPPPQQPPPIQASAAKIKVRPAPVAFPFRRLCDLPSLLGRPAMRRIVQSDPESASRSNRSLTRRLPERERERERRDATDRVTIRDAESAVPSGWSSSKVIMKKSSVVPFQRNDNVQSETGNRQLFVSDFFFDKRFDYAHSRCWHSTSEFSTRLRIVAFFCCFVFFSGVFVSETTGPTRRRPAGGVVIDVAAADCSLFRCGTVVSFFHVRPSVRWKETESLEKQKKEKKRKPNQTKSQQVKKENTCRKRHSNKMPHFRFSLRLAQFFSFSFFLSDVFPPSFSSETTAVSTPSRTLPHKRKQKQRPLFSLMAVHPATVFLFPNPRDSPLEK